MKKNEQIVIGALLHDIGKFMQRANLPNKYLHDDNEKSRVCKTTKYGTFSHYHSLYTSLFMEEYEKYFPKTVEKFEKIEDNFSNYASCHHNPRTVIGLIINEADMLSSGMDRISTEDVDTEDTIPAEKSKFDFRKERMVSIFSEINLIDAANKEKNRYVYEISPLDFEKNIFPFVESEKKDLSSEYLKNWENFLSEFKKINRNNINNYIQMLSYLLEKYTWSIPSSTIDFPDISLFDHSYTTASISSTLYNYHEDTNFNEAEIKDRKIKKFFTYKRRFKRNTKIYL